MRLLITGKTRSGKSTTLHQLLSDLLSRQWLEILLLDGKGVELAPYANLQTTYHSPLNYYSVDKLDQWAVNLDRIANQLGDRFTSLAKRNLRAAAPGDPRILIIADEVQIGCRDKTHGGKIKQSLTRISEQSAALNDVLILTCQREQNSVPPAVRWNCNAKLRMLGAGFFHYQPDGRAPVAGRIPYITPQEAKASIQQSPNAQLDITADQLLDIMHASHSRQHLDSLQPARANATLYLGGDGSGKTWRLHNHSKSKAGVRTERYIFADLQEPHRAWLLNILEQCGAGAPPRASVSQLRDMTLLAIRAETTTLLLDNLHAPNTKARATIIALIDGAENVALAATQPNTPALERKIKPFITRCKIIRIPPLTADEAKALANSHLPDDIPKRSKTLRRIVNMADGHPASIVNLCHQAKLGTLPELRTLENAPRRLNVVFLLIIPLLFMLFIWRYSLDSYMLSALVMVALMLSRPFLYRSLRRT